MTDMRMADISEHQSNIDGPAYIAGGYPIIICRTHNGNRTDNTMPGRRDYLRGCKFTGIGWYQYLVASRSPTDQAHDFIQTIGTLAGDEWPILDLEEGSGDQTGRAQEWFNVVDAWAGFPAMLYAGDYFMREQLSGAGHWGSRPLWLASYPSNYQPDPSNEPSSPHLLWQYSDRASFPGLAGGVDGNIARNVNAGQFMTTVRSGKATPQPPSQEDIVAIAAAMNQGGALHVFVEDKNGKIWYTYQSPGKNAWNGGQAGKSIAGLVPFAPAPK
jgi:GH25 family lysozyme M1 (1,4-beta-N-acetylmuramidase)